MSDDNINSNESKQQTHLIFSYGTLKRGFPNHYLMQQLMDQNAAVFLGPYCTHESYPLVCGPYNIPYLINLPGSGNRVKGELYSVSTQGLARLDELEGTRFGHYERLPIRLAEGGREGNDGNGAVSVAAVEAEGYFLNRSFGEGLWEKKGKVGMNEYTEYEGQEYVAIHKRAKGVCIVDEIASFLSSDWNIAINSLVIIFIVNKTTIRWLKEPRHFLHPYVIVPAKVSFPLV